MESLETYARSLFGHKGGIADIPDIWYKKSLGFPAPPAR